MILVKIMLIQTIRVLTKSHVFLSNSLFHLLLTSCKIYHRIWLKFGHMEQSLES